MRKISITEALNELKLYDSKITKAIGKNVLVGATKKISPLVGVMSRDDFEEKVKANFQSVKDLIRNRNALKSAVVVSNAKTIVEIDGVTMTVAEAIERKSSIDYEKFLLDEMKTQYSQKRDVVLSENVKVDRQIDKLLEGFVGRDSDKKPSKEDQAAIVEPYKAKNEYELVDPIGILNEIEKLENSINGFESEVDTRLALSNATTFIELDM